MPSTLSPENEYPKLVRDRIPEIIKAKTGIEIKTRTLAGDDEFLEYLLLKFVEESVELKNSVQAGNLEEELADLFELIYTLLNLRGKTIEDIIVLQKAKREKRGGFDKRILMLEKT